MTKDRCLNSWGSVNILETEYGKRVKQAEVGIPNFKLLTRTLIHKLYIKFKERLKKRYRLLRSLLKHDKLVSRWYLGNSIDNILYIL